MAVAVLPAPAEQRCSCVLLDPSYMNEAAECHQNVETFKGGR